MSTLIVFSTKYGCTENCANMLAQRLKGKTELLNLKKDSNKTVDLSKYDKVIVGGSIYIGQIQKEVTQFCSQNSNLLADKKVGLFVCCMRDGESLDAQIEGAFPKELLNRAVAKDTFGGEFILSKMGFLDRLITKAVAKTNRDTSNILEANINRFAQLMNNA